MKRSLEEDDDGQGSDSPSAKRPYSKKTLTNSVLLQQIHFNKIKLGIQWEDHPIEVHLATVDMDLVLEDTKAVQADQGVRMEIDLHPPIEVGHLEEVVVEDSAALEAVTDHLVNGFLDHPDITTPTNY